jgi:hypothetical protein
VNQNTAYANAMSSLARARKALAAKGTSYWVIALFVLALGMPLIRCGAHYRQDRIDCAERLRALTVVAMISREAVT